LPKLSVPGNPNSCRVSDNCHDYFQPILAVLVTYCFHISEKNKKIFFGASLARCSFIPVSGLGALRLGAHQTTAQEGYTMSRFKLLPLFMLLLPSAVAGEVKVAVAANFTPAMKEIAAAFTEATGHRTLISYGSTGKLYAQITHGAPFEVLLAADEVRPRRLASAGLADEPFTYAVGKLVLWSADPERIDEEAEVLKTAQFRKLAIVNPKTAPYGAAALQVMESLGSLRRLKPKLVRGDNIAQTYQFILTGNAQLGFVALSQVTLNPQGSRWDPPQELYDPIRQDAVLLARGADNPAATALIDFLKGPQARAVIEKYGYGAY
jgi:molybdate transport system substrate-binding protein